MEIMGAIMYKQNLFTSNSKKTASLVLMLLLILLSIILFINTIIPQYTYEYTASLLDKVERLEMIDESKIVLIGNSNLAFGINSEQLEQAFAMPVVNMGLHGGLGNSFHEQFIKDNINKGDIIIIAYTDYNDIGELPDPELAWVTLENHLELWKYIEAKNLKSLWSAFPGYLKKAVTLWESKTGNKVPDNIYSRQAFNEYGDIYWDRVGTEIDFASTIYVPSVSKECACRLNKLNQYIIDHGATMLIAAQPIPEGEYTPDEKEYIQFQNELENHLDAPVISDFTDYLMDYKYFYNSIYHLNSEGADIRTKQLIKDIKRWKGIK